MRDKKIIDALVISQVSVEIFNTELKEYIGKGYTPVINPPAQLVRKEGEGTYLLHTACLYKYET